MGLRRGRIRRRRAGALFGLVAVLASTTWGAEAATTSDAFADAAGLHVVAVSQVDSRQYNVEILSADLGRPVNVRILLPVGYSEHPDARYPVLYLFHGTSGTAKDWVDAGHAEQSTAPYGLITVMPDAGFNGDGGFWFTDWVDRNTSHGPSQYEHYFIQSLVPWVDDNLRTIPRRDGRAVAGLSQGGYGSAEMAARHPDMFVSMASFSGAPEIERDPQIFAGAAAIITAIEVGDDQVPPFSELGNPATDLINWKGHDPATLVTNLRETALYLWTGTGLDGPYDAAPNPAASLIEGAAYQSTQQFYDHLVAEGIPVYYDNYVYGTHTFPYWARDLQQYLPMLMNDFAHPKVPATISYMSIDRTWSQWGYTVTFDRPAVQEFGALTNSSASGFTVAGSGVATVTTPPFYQPGTSVRVTVNGPTGPAKEILAVSGNGRVTVVIRLGQNQQAGVSIQPGS